MAYQQKELDIGSQKYTTISTSKGLFQYTRFIYGLASASTLLYPLHCLLKSSVIFEWFNSCAYAFDELKNLLASENCLAHFNFDFTTKLTVDSSPVGVGAVLSQVDDKGIEKPIEFASRALTATEKRYSQLDREAVAILFEVKKFHQYF